MVSRRFSPLLRGMRLLFLCAVPLQAQGGKEVLEWLRLYSPTGYFIINDYESRANQPGWHKQYLNTTPEPLFVVAVHETGHMRNLNLNGRGSAKSFYVDNRKDYQVTPGFKAFSTSEIIPDVPANFKNVYFNLYVNGGEGSYAVSEGLIGLWEEWNQFIATNKTSMEMGECYQANFNTTKSWEALANDNSPQLTGISCLRYFVLRYVMTAQKSHPDVYAKIIGNAQIKECYSLLVLFAENSARQWIDLLKSRNMDTQTKYGFAEYWKFYNEIQKPEYQDLEKILMVPTAIAPIFPARSVVSARADGFDLRGRRLQASRPGAGIYLDGKGARIRLIPAH